MLEKTNQAAGQVPGQLYYCRIIINGIEFKSQNIEDLCIREWINEILPRIEVHLGNKGDILEVLPITDGNEIEVLISKHQDSDETIHATFIISDHSITVESDNRIIHLTISGYLKNNNLFVPIKTRSFKKKNSEEVLRIIAEESGLKFKNPLNVKPTDKMNWYQINKSNYDFISHVLQRSYVSDDAIMFFGNVKNEFIYTSLKKELFKKQNTIAKWSIEMFNRNYLNDDEIKTIWFNTYDIVNYCSYFNRIIGYGSKYTYVDNNKGVEVPKSYNDKNTAKISDYVYRNKLLDGKHVFNSTYGIYNDLNLYGEKYFESFERNYSLLSTTLAMSVLINVNSLHKINLCDKINLMLPSLIDQKISDPYSGLYIVSGITHFISNGGVYQKMVSLSRNGINKPFDRKITTLVK